MSTALSSDPQSSKLTPSGSQLPTTAYSSNHIHLSPIMARKSTQMIDVVSTNSDTVLLATALVTVQNEHTGQSFILRALLDQGWECTLISEHAAQALCLKRTTTFANIIGVGHNTSNQARFEVQLSIRSRINPQFRLTIVRAYILKSLTGLVPGQHIKPQAWPHLQDLTLADPHYNEPSKINLILGADVYGHLILPDIRNGNQNQPVAQRTYFGWVFLGQTKSTLASHDITSHAVTIRCHHSSVDLSSIVQRYFEQDQVPQESELTAEEQWCENFFKQTHTRHQDGKYEVRLPLKSHFDPTQALGRSRQIALKRFHSLEHKLNSKPHLREQYTQVMQEYFDLDQIIPAITTEKQNSTVNIFNQPTTTSCVLPHHAVLKEESLTTKARIVFDASCKTSNGKSLNDLLYIGPPLQNELPAVILNWRMHKFVFTADIQKMYRCINMNSADSQFQRVLWRDHNNDIREYCLTTVTFGTVSAPYTAIRVIHLLAEDEKHRFPLAEHILKSEIYVDDVLSGSHSIDTAIELRNQVTAALQSAGMHLRKWCSNTTELLVGIEPEHLSSTDLMQ